MGVSCEWRRLDRPRRGCSEPILPDAEKQRRKRAEETNERDCRINRQLGLLFGIDHGD
jgi:hypothetical protein